MNLRRKLIALSLLSLFLILPFRINAKLQDDFPTIREGLYYKYTTNREINRTLSILEFSLITFETTYYVEKVEGNYARITADYITYENGTKVDEGKGIFVFNFTPGVDFVGFAFNRTNLREKILDAVIGMVLNESQLSFTETTYVFNGMNRTVYRVFYNYTEGEITRIRNMIVDKKTGLIFEDTRIHIDRTNYTIASYSQNEHIVLVDTNFFGKTEIIIFIIIIVIIAIPILTWYLWFREKRKSNLFF